MEELGYVYFDNWRREEITHFKRFSYFPSVVFVSTKSDTYCLNETGFFKCLEVFNNIDKVIEIEYTPAPIVFVTLPIEDEGGDI